MGATRRDEAPPEPSRNGGDDGRLGGARWAKEDRRVGRGAGEGGEVGAARHSSSDSSSPRQPRSAKRVGGGEGEKRLDHLALDGAL